MTDSFTESSTLIAEHDVEADENGHAWHKILLGLALGVITGVLFGDKGPIASIEHPSFSLSLLQHSGQAILYLADPIGTLFINAIKMMVIPVVFVSIVCGVISFNDPKLMGNIGFKTLTVYILTMSIAVCIGLGVASYIQPGLSVHIPHLTQINAHAAAEHGFSLKEILVQIIPENPVQAFATANVLQTVVFAVIFGLAIICSGHHGMYIANFFKRLSHVIEHIPKLIMKFAPVGVFALITTVTATFGIEVMKDLFTAVITIYIGCAIQLFVVYALIIRFVLGLRVSTFYKKMMTAMTFAFSTTSSSATLPYTRDAALDLGVSKRMADFIVPLGATMNMNGLTVYLGVATVFAANLMHIHLGIWQMLMVISTGTLAAIGAAGVPGSALVVMSLVMGSIGFSSEAIALVIGLFAGVDRIIDMASTTLNITGDALASVIVAHKEKELDKEQYTRST